MLLAMWDWAASLGLKAAEQWLPLYHGIEALLWAGVLVALLNVRGRALGLFANPVLGHLGKVSYSLYLVHLPVQIYFLAPLMMRWGQGKIPLLAADSLWRIMLSALAVWGLACLAYWLVERPFLRLKAYLPVFRSRASAAAA